MAALDLLAELAKLAAVLAPIVIGFMAGGSSQRSADFKKSNEVKDAQLRAALDRPQSRADLTQRMLGGNF